VLADSQQLDLAEAPLIEPVQGDVIELAEPVAVLPPGRALLVSGRRPVLRVAEGIWSLKLSTTNGGRVALHPGDTLTVTGPSSQSDDKTRTWPVQLRELAGTLLVAPGEVEFLQASTADPVVTEFATVGEPAAAGLTMTVIKLAARLAGAYDRISLRIAGNVAAASHGETRTEVLGSGDATVTFQRFRLAQSPLSYIAAAGPGGVASTLQILVDGERWSEVPSLHVAAPVDHVYIVRIDGSNRVTVTFGDGVTGARLPTGAGNVTAIYRVGTGLAGVLGAGRLTLPMTRPLGLRSVTNPLPTGLAADPDPLHLLRRNAPNAALALDRVVSLTDYADFARGIAGIAKASATWRLVNEEQVIELTVDGDAGQRVDKAARDALQTALAATGDPHQRVVITNADRVGFDVSATLFVQPDRPPGTVKATATAALLAAFGFDARDLGEQVTASEVMAAVQAVPGVVAVTLSGFPAAIPAAPGQLLTVNPQGISLVEAKS
jgi:predicted phage baseplate assembly protein